MFFRDGSSGFIRFWRLQFGFSACIQLDQQVVRQMGNLISGYHTSIAEPNIQTMHNVRDVADKMAEHTIF